MPFERQKCVVDTNVLSDFYQCECLKLIWDLYPQGVWIDPYVSEELKVRYMLDVQHELQQLGLFYNFTNNYEPEHYLEMAEIKSRRRALKTADISCIVNAKMNDATCLSADNAVYKTCTERGLKAARHGGILEECVRRELITRGKAREYFLAFLDRGLTMKPSVRDELLAIFTDGR
ncbi:hypothetical protein GRAQ_00090 [Rahnella aquatilis CIP 78.65 = ATCC 33071]|uniref:PIN domain-containing protein n=1 Tax=Rahnella aquatilis (strain ATCC 33071 / DSM 4594 / JCM 1683 / NBRC 105701 / NCIMB 13365 / CIP 78.65) TaxID=745277 RepID=H2IYK8_RAHAC|nr:hypothetical protein [Rahnella aquatilis]AEX50944.1 hypothetical protein Rahaq2_1052 [Rahnella aquatilis CIP 78.65 = ATCC 33071]KFD18539.1 hypothetical protein GRAQ_00090 [Rahnella aquatilis CIP 78.65 = ATCC 33071]